MTTLHCALAELSNEADTPAELVFGPFSTMAAASMSVAIIDRNVDETSAAARFSNAYVLSVRLADARARGWTQDGAGDMDHDLAVGDLVIHDLRHTPQMAFDTPSRALNVHVPRAVFDQLAKQANVGAFVRLMHGVSAPIRDKTVLNIVRSLEPALGLNQKNSLFIEQLTLALVTHVALTYGDFATHEPLHRGGLAPWQMRRAKDLLMGSLSTKICLREVAQRCDLSLSHFNRAFRKSFNEAPYQFVLKARIEAAKSLIRQRSMAMSDISVACGFANQSHMTRMFSREVGVSPVAWRRACQRDAQDANQRL